ncbi:threonine/homoserine efflux transporter RhtA [Winogradskyella epiphytica]|uniref:Threonine/homoserine efflux transporter RhtA n=1 Tax=Winogradskyella epiphytica TaxID=262005 RepID=A0A2V4Y3K9_9FLAO|nr:DMT family transporter [Winogradskyella epiphytica]PYE83474.1 threonine/homoserine efflux transporter RhtA [Winogradskyella epiphytica]
MNENSHIKHVFWLTVATLCISTSGALGRYIALPAPVLIWWRAAFAVGILYLFCRYKGLDLKINSARDYRTFIISGLLMGAHWITYVYALKLSNVALSVLALFTYPIITALLEPLFSKVKLDPIHIILGLIILLGIYILAPEFSLENDHVLGILFGILSAFCYAIRTLILKQHVTNYNPTMLMFYQVVIISIVLIPVLFFMDSSNIKTQYPYVILLALLATAIGHTMFVNSLKHFKVSTASIIGSMQPVFGIIIAYLFLNEIPTMSTLAGGSLILATVVIESIRSRRK